MSTPFHDLVDQLRKLADRLEGHADALATGQVPPPAPDENQGPAADPEPPADTPAEVETPASTEPPADGPPADAPAVTPEPTDPPLHTI